MIGDVYLKLGFGEGSFVGVGHIIDRLDGTQKLRALPPERASRCSIGVLTAVG